MKKNKILFISDHQLLPSGVGTQAKYLIEGLLATGKYSFYCLGGAVRHPDYRIQKISPEKFGEDWVIQPVDGFGDKKLLRKLLVQEKPDALFMFTDPRFFVWLWEMEDEVRSVCPIFYWHVWDNDPPPRFNKTFYDSTDVISPLSLKTYGLLRALGRETKYIPHAVPSELFKPIPEEVVMKFRADRYGPHADKKFILFWNNRNARRKVTGDVIESFAKFAERVGKKNVALMMHTAPKDPEGQDILALAQALEIDRNLIISDQRIMPEDLNLYYNAADCTINIASNEGFGLGTLESLMAGTPIVVHMTGGLQFQAGDWWRNLKGGDFSDQISMTKLAKQRWHDKRSEWWGAPVFPASRSNTGSQQIPYIYDDRVNQDDVVKALEHVYEMGRPERKRLGHAARAWAMMNFDLEKMVSDWDALLEDGIRKFNEVRPTQRRVVTL